MIRSRAPVSSVSIALPQSGRRIRTTSVIQSRPSAGTAHVSVVRNTTIARRTFSVTSSSNHWRTIQRRLYSTTDSASSKSIGALDIGDTLAHSFHGIAAQPFPEEVANRLKACVEPRDVEIRPDGIIYLPEIKYRRILNTAIGPGGWALMPRPNTERKADGSYSREYALWCFGRFVSQARGEQSYQEKSMQDNLGFLDESSRSNALMRCCKDLGIASELWDPAFISEWKNNHAIEVWVENISKGPQQGQKRKLWRRKDAPPINTYPWKETGDAPKKSDPTLDAPPIRPPDSPVSVVATNTAASPSSTASTGVSSGTSRSKYGSGGDIDMNSPVPPQFKKYAGKTWLEVASSPEGLQYLNWAQSHEKFGADLRAKAKKAAELYEAARSFDEGNTPE